MSRINLAILHQPRIQMITHTANTFLQSKYIDKASTNKTSGMETKQSKIAIKTLSIFSTKAAIPPYMQPIIDVTNVQINIYQ